MRAARSSRNELGHEVSKHAGSVSSDLQLAIQAAAAAGGVIAAGAADRAYGEGPDIEQKDVGDLVSEIDREADRVVTDLLRQNSRLPILSEELNSGLPECPDQWIVDPLDASSAYLMQAGNQYPSVLVAQRRSNQIQVGVCYFPLTNEWFYAYRGKGAWKNGKRLVCDDREGLADIWVEMNQYGNSALQTEFFTGLNRRLRSPQGARLVTGGVPNAGVAARIAECQLPLAAAVHDNNPASVKQGPWDIAAPQLILEEAGGVFLNPEGQRTDPFVVEPIIVARSESLGRAILALTRDHSRI